VHLSLCHRNNPMYVPTNGGDDDDDDERSLQTDSKLNQNFIRMKEKVFQSN
jgi:hypothetical protein